MKQALATVGIAALWFGAPVAQQVFRSSVDLVNLGVVVTGRNGAPVLGLTREDFTIEEDGVAQTLTHFAGGIPRARRPSTSRS